MSAAGRPTVVFCGAGISIDPPSRLPSGEELALQVLELLLDASDTVVSPDDVRELRSVVQSIRLELALELLSRHIEAATLVRIYACLRGAEPNYNHLALAYANLRAIVTTNQDVLLETAATRLGTTPKILHLHGRCDQPETIVTMISQYMAGLSTDAVRALRDAVTHQNVLVLGYSGRDRDVMAVLEDSDPARIHWLVHPGSAVSPELSELRHSLGAKIEIEIRAARDEIAQLLTLDQEIAIERKLNTASNGSSDIPSEVRAQFAAIGLIPRNLGLAEILRHASRYREVDHIYAALGGVTPKSPIRVRLAIGSTLAHRREFDAAIHTYATITGATEATALERCLALVGEVEALRNSSRGAQALQKLTEFDDLITLVPASRDRSRVIGRAASHRAGLARVEGDIPAALSSYSAALCAFDESRDLDEKLETVCWRADVLRLKGYYLEAHAEVSAALQESLLYVRHYARAWALFVSADIDCARGELASCAQALDLAAEQFLKTGNHQATLWIDLLRAAERRANGRLDEAEIALEVAARRLSSGSIPLHLAEARLGLERAELARARRASLLVARHLQEVEEVLASSRHFGSRPAYLFLHARLVEAEYRRTNGEPGVGDELTRIAQEYEALGFHGCAARARVGAWLCATDAPPPQDLLDDCRQHGRQHELARLEYRTLNAYPILFA